MRIISILSGKGGVGKTTVTANIGVALTMLGKSVTIIDANITTPHLGINFGIFNYPITLNDVLKGKVNSVVDAMYFHDTGLRIIPSALNVEELYGVDIMDLEKVVQKVPMSDFVLIDSAPGIGREAIAAIQAAQELLYVTNPNIAAVTDIVKVSEVAKRLGKKQLGIVINSVKRKMHELTVDEIEEFTGLPVLAMIPYDNAIEKALSLGKTVVEYNPYSNASIEFMKLAAKLAGEEYKPPKVTFIHKLKNYFASMI